MSRTETLVIAESATVECATCGELAVQSPHDTSVWVHVPTRDAGWSLPNHRVVRAR